MIATTIMTSISVNPAPRKREGKSFRRDKEITGGTSKNKLVASVTECVFCETPLIGGGWPLVVTIVANEFFDGTCRANP